MFKGKDGGNVMIEVDGWEYFIKLVMWINVNKEGKLVGLRI